MTDVGAPATGDAGDREIEAIAVRPGRRDTGIGTALVRGAVERTPGDLLAAFDADVRPFYERLGFALEPIEERRGKGGRRDGRQDRYRGRLIGESDA